MRSFSQRMHGSIYISADTLDDTFFKKDEIGLWTLVTKDWGNNPDKNSLNIRLYSSNIQNFYVSKYLSLKNKQTDNVKPKQEHWQTAGMKLSGDVWDWIHKPVDEFCLKDVWKWGNKDDSKMGSNVTDRNKVRR